MRTLLNKVRNDLSIVNGWLMVCKGPHYGTSASLVGGILSLQYGYKNYQLVIRRIVVRINIYIY